MRARCATLHPSIAAGSWVASYAPRLTRCSAIAGGSELAKNAMRRATRPRGDVIKGEPSPPELINHLARLALSLGGLEQRKMFQRIADGALGNCWKRLAHREGQVRSGLSPGGNRIRTSGPTLMASSVPAP